MKLIAMLLAVGALLLGCGEDGGANESGEPETPIDEATIDQLLQNPEAYAGTEVIVIDATVRAIEPEGGFVLESNEARILVSAPNPTPDLQPGDQVPVQAEVVRFTEPAAEQLGEEFGGLGNVPTDVGDPYLLLRRAPVDPEESGPGDTPDDLDDQPDGADASRNSTARYASSRRSPADRCTQPTCRSRAA